MPEAARYYAQSLKNDPGNADAAGAGLLLCHHLGRHGERRQIRRRRWWPRSPDDRAARLTLAVVAFKHSDYAEARKQLSLSAKGPFTA